MVEKVNGGYPFFILYVDDGLLALAMHQQLGFHTHKTG